MIDRRFHIWFSVGHLANDWPIAALWLIVPAAGISMALTPTEVGLLFTILNLGGALAYLPAGLIADHASNRGRWLLLTFWWIVIGYAIATFAPSFWGLAALLALAGMGNAAWHPIAAGILSQESKGDRAWALGVHAIGGSLAEILAPLSVGILLAWMGWREALLVSVLPTLLVGLCLVPVVRNVPRVRAKPLRRADVFDFLSAWRGRCGLRIIGMISLYNMAAMALLSMIPLFLADAYDLNAGVIAVIFSAGLVAGAVLQPAVGRLSDRKGRRPVMVSGMLIAAMACLGIVKPLPLSLVLLGLGVAVAAIDAIRSTMLAIAVDHGEQREGTTLGLAFALMEGVGAAGAVIAGIAASMSWSWMFAFAASCLMLAAVLAHDEGRKSESRD